MSDDTSLFQCECFGCPSCEFLARNSEPCDRTVSCNAPLDQEYCCGHRYGWHLCGQCAMQEKREAVRRVLAIVDRERSAPGGHGTATLYDLYAEIAQAMTLPSSGKRAP